MESFVIVSALVLSLVVGLVVARVALEAVLFLMMRPAAPGAKHEAAEPAAAALDLEAAA